MEEYNNRMILRKWDDLPDYLKNDRVKYYYGYLSKKKLSLVMKRLFDIVVAFFMLILLTPLFIILSIIIKMDSKGPVLFRQIRVTQYGKSFKIFKFRTMINDAEKSGTQVTVNNDQRVTRVGKVLRKYRLDEIPQLLNILAGDMSFVGTRPEVIKYVEHYNDEMLATLLLPAGVTSETSIRYKDEEKILTDIDDVDRAYIEIVLPEKMKINLKSIKEFSFFNDIKTMLRTVLAVIKK